MKASRFALAAATIWAATAALNPNGVQAQQTPEKELRALFTYSKLAVEPSEYESQVTQCDGSTSAQDSRTVVPIPDPVIEQIEERLPGRDNRDNGPSAQRWLRESFARWCGAHQRRRGDRDMPLRCIDERHPRFQSAES